MGLKSNIEKYETKIARLSKMANPLKNGGAKPGI
jgi:hypothetical protein